MKKKKESQWCDYSPPHVFFFGGLKLHFVITISVEFNSTGKTAQICGVSFSKVVNPTDFLSTRNIQFLQGQTKVFVHGVTFL